ncbi:hypothetical protein Aph01nite_79460 [Acrocarpospora phusangensis]|uniref:Uncharacterized protein n=1 Tax=Acrocarpospora phusangensis TaxID=1070424 RepID=A0A919QIT1_9ACTN|nr:hypothetical protein Aph01nite_79460 [Acrocarpospora phusangensis]
MDLDHVLAGVAVVPGQPRQLPPPHAGEAAVSTMISTRRPASGPARRASASARMCFSCGMGRPWRGLPPAPRRLTFRFRHGLTVISYSCTAAFITTDSRVRIPDTVAGA